jgi:hypothetical protein
MELKKSLFIMNVAAIVGLYGVANAMLWYERSGFTYFDDNLFLIMTSIFLVMILRIIPRAVEMMLGGEPQTPGYEINEINEEHTSDYGSTSQH